MQCFKGKLMQCFKENQWCSVLKGNGNEKATKALLTGIYIKIDTQQFFTQVYILSAKNSHLKVWKT